LLQRTQLAVLEDVNGMPGRKSWKRKVRKAISTGTAQSQVILGDEQLALFRILGPVDLATGKTPIENVDRCGA
jgi:hypothetical protein